MSSSQRLSIMVAIGDGDSPATATIAHLDVEGGITYHHRLLWRKAHSIEQCLSHIRCRFGFEAIRTGHACLKERCHAMMLHDMVERTAFARSHNAHANALFP